MTSPNQIKDETEARVCAWLAEQREAMLTLLADLVNTDSGSYDKAGVDAVGLRLVAFLDEHGINKRVTPIADYGDAIEAETGPAGSGAPILLMGHRDTVFPKGEAERRPFKVADGRAYGPGVADMKAGLTMNSFVLAALKHHGALSAPVKALYTGDEEIGSRGSRPIIEAAARGARAVFNSEPGRPSGNVVSQRKGGVFSRFSIIGKPAHSGVDYANGISAIEELARKVTALHAITDLERGTTVNVGIVAGGQSVNTVAPNASGQIDLRYQEPEERERALRAIQDIVEASLLPGTRSELEVVSEFLPLKPTPDSETLLALYQSSARDIGFTVEGEFTGGCADSGFTAALGTPTLCGVGPVGGRAHSEEEYLEVETLVPRAQAVALSILRLSRGEA